MFRIGQKVVCVDDSPQSCRGTVRLLVADQTYTIRWVGMHKYRPHHPLHSAGAALAVRLEEIHREPLNPLGERDMPFRASRFRPVVERKTDTGMAILEEIRKRESMPADERVRADLSAGDGSR